MLIPPPPPPVPTPMGKITYSSFFFRLQVYTHAGIQRQKTLKALQYIKGKGFKRLSFN